MLCGDDDNVKSILSKVPRRVIEYGLNENAEVRAIDVTTAGTQMKFTILRPNHAPLPVVLNLAGLHNVRNALAAVAIATLVGVSDEAIVKGLAEFTGVGRRFARYGAVPVTDADGKTVGTFELVDDYGHHPHEMAATIAAVRGAWPDKRLVLVFQPHRYTRTRDCFEDLVKVLKDADVLVLGEVYPAGETPIAGADGRSLARAVRLVGRGDLVFCDKIEEMPEAVRRVVRPGDVVLTMGAGSIGRVPGLLAHKEI